MSSKNSDRFVWKPGELKLVTPSAAKNKWEHEQQAFRRLLPELLRTHTGQYVAIHGGEVVESGPDKLAVAERAYARFGYVPIYVSLVSDEPSLLIRIPSPKLSSTEESL
jgi:hypothetical protein